MDRITRVRLVVDPLAVGVVVGALGVALLLSIDGRLASAVAPVFSLGALAFGIGLLGWSGSILAGRGIENMQHYLETGTDWTESKSRTAMARIGGFGAGVMVGSSLLDVLLRSVLAA